MDQDFETLETARPRARGIGGRLVLILIIFAFVGGAAGSAWLVTRYDLLGTQKTASREASERAALRSPPRAMTPPPAAPAGSARGVDTALLDVQIGAMEDRLARLSVSAQGAAGEASRAEALLIAASARRAAERGIPLGYLADQLQGRFGEREPGAVRTLVNASSDPITIEQLQGGLAEIGQQLTMGAPGSSLWDSLKRETSELFVLRRVGTPSPAPTQRLARAQRFLASGNIAAAISEVRRLPGRDAGEEWLAAANRYLTVQQALEAIERSALTMPRALPTPPPAEPAAPPAPAPEAAPAPQTPAPAQDGLPSV